MTLLGDALNSDTRSLKSVRWIYTTSTLLKKITKINVDLKIRCCYSYYIETGNAPKLKIKRIGIMKITSQEYFAEVKAIAEDIVKDAIKQAEGNRDDALDLINGHLLDEAIDNHQWVIYYAYNLDVYQYSDNPDYFVDNFGGDIIVHALKENGLDGLHQALAFWCLYADVMDKIQPILDEHLSVKTFKH